MHSKKILPSSKRRIIINKNKISSTKALKAMRVTLYYYAFFHKHYKIKLPTWSEMEQEFFKNIGIDLEANFKKNKEHTWPKYYWVLIQTFRIAHTHIFEPRNTEYNLFTKDIDYIDKKYRILNVHTIYRKLTDTKTLDNFQSNGF
tara:strand:- start:17 stop:451 length:435 start_codon:yes stop_codon:yes gene_type:complete